MAAPKSFVTAERALQGEWFTRNLAQHQGYAGFAYRVPPLQRLLNVADHVRVAADLHFSAKPVIQWHQHANHGLSSQVCCVNFLLPLAQRPEVLRRWLEHVTGEQVSEVLPIEPHRGGEPWYLTFEWIGAVDHLNESKNGAARARGANATAADAAVLFRDATGKTQLLLIEWKYTERYGQPLGPGGNPTRRLRYEQIFCQPNGPVRAGAGVELDDFFWEPFYQMLRQQMLAWHTERSDPTIDRARVLHLSPSGNLALHKVTSPALRPFGDDAFTVFRSLLANPEDFIDMPIERAFAPLAEWPDAPWYPWLKERYPSLCTASKDFC